jgi:hypothetical protein
MAGGRRVARPLLKAQRSGHAGLPFEAQGKKPGAYTVKSRSEAVRFDEASEAIQVPSRSTARQPRVNANGNGPGSLVRYAPSKKTRARSPMASSN